MRVFNGRKEKTRPLNGFTLLELIVVMTIIGILATQVALYFTSTTPKVKGAIFNIKNAFNLARAEAVKQNLPVVVKFIFADPDGDGSTADGTDIDGDGDTDDGYRICVDDNENGDCDPGETSIPGIPTAGVPLDDAVRFYYRNATDGPCKDISCGAFDLEDGAGEDDDGVTFTGSRFAMQPDGTANKNGTVYLYAPDPDNHATMKTAPYASVVFSSGRVRLTRWVEGDKQWSPNDNGCGACP